MPQQISGIALASVATGFVFVYAGIKGKSITQSFQAVLQGKSPGSASTTNPIAGATTESSTGDSTTGNTGSSSVPPTSGSNEAVLKEVAASFGWTGSQWTCLYNVEMAEAGFNLTATNPSSGAYGMAQFINGPSEYAQYGGDSTTARGQSIGMCNYIKQRYGTPCAAWAHEQSFHWY